MKYQIDQSGKIEQTNIITVVAFSNGESGSLLLSAKDKKILQEIFRKANKTKIFSIQVFAALVFLLIKNYMFKNETMVIDKEYPGHENLIRSYIVQLVNTQPKIKIEASNINFKTIGKSSNAHEVANKCFKNRKAEKNTNFKEVLALVLAYK